MGLPPHTDGEMGLSYPIFRLPNYPQATGTLPNKATIKSQVVMRLSSEGKDVTLTSVEEW